MYHVNCKKIKQPTKIEIKNTRINKNVQNEID